MAAPCVTERPFFYASASEPRTCLTRFRVGLRSPRVAALLACAGASSEFRRERPAEAELKSSGLPWREKALQRVVCGLVQIEGPECGISLIQRIAQRTPDFPRS